MLEVRLEFFFWENRLGRKHKGVFWNARNVLYLDMGDYIWKNASKCALKI